MNRIEIENSYAQVTRDIKVSVVPSYLAEQSDPTSNIYAFNYKVTLENFGLEAAQLVNRHWKVFSGGKQIADVKGEGVVGEQPILAPGANYTYSSGTVINSTHGSMLGTYTFISEQKEFFDVEIPEFHLIYFANETLH